MNDDPAIFCSLTVFIGARYWSWYRSVPPTNQSPRIHMSTCSYNFVSQVWLFLHWERWSAGPQPHTGDGGGCQGRRGRGQLGGDYQVRLISISYKWEMITRRPQHFSICWCVTDVDNLHYRWDTAWRTSLEDLAEYWAEEQKVTMMRTEEQRPQPGAADRPLPHLPPPPSLGCKPYGRCDLRKWMTGSVFIGARYCSWYRSVLTNQGVRIHALTNPKLESCLYNLQLCLSGRSDDDALTGRGGALLIHNSHNTEHKQWSEMQVLTISRVSWVFVNKRSLLHSRGDFPKACRLLLEHVEKLALSPTQEVSIAKFIYAPLNFPNVPRLPHIWLSMRWGWEMGV